jgi:CNT family concentrative nucleoside transporter
MERFQSFLGLLGLLGFLLIFTRNWNKVSYKFIFSGVLLQFVFAFFILKTSFGRHFFECLKVVFTELINMSDYGAEFVFGKNFRDHFIAFKVLPSIIFFSAFASWLFHIGFLERLIKILAILFQKTLGLSGRESLVTAANIFFGQTEAPMLIKPYLKELKMFELHTMMITGMATMAGGVLAAYVGLGIPAHHLLAASVMAAPAAVVVSRILCPITKLEFENLDQNLNMDISKSTNVFEAIADGASDGTKLALNVAAMLIAMLGLIGVVDALLGFFHESLKLQDILGHIFRPVAFLIGVSWEDSQLVGRMLGEKMVLNEFIAFLDFKNFLEAGVLSERSKQITTYALSGFANFSSIAVQVGGIGNIEPSRKKDFAKVGFKAMLGGTCSSLMTACIAGMLL